MPNIVGARGSSEGGGSRERRGSRARGPVGSEPPGFRQAPFMLLLVVESLAQAACQPSRSLSPREVALIAKPAFPVPGDECHLEGSPPPPRVSVWPHTPAGTPESLILPLAPVTGPPTAQTTLAAPPPGPLQGSTSGWEPWMEGGSSRRWNRMKSPFSEARRGRAVAVSSGSMRRA